MSKIIYHYFLALFFAFGAGLSLYHYLETDNWLWACSFPLLAILAGLELGDFVIKLRGIRDERNVV